MIIGYAFYFIVLSFTSKLPWEKCGDWSSPSNCFNRECFAKIKPRSGIGAFKIASTILWPTSPTSSAATLTRPSSATTEDATIRPGWMARSLHAARMRRSSKWSAGTTLSTRVKTTGCNWTLLKEPMLRSRLNRSPFLQKGCFAEKQRNRWAWWTGMAAGGGLRFFVDTRVPHGHQRNQSETFYL